MSEELKLHVPPPTTHHAKEDSGAHELGMKYCPKSRSKPLTPPQKNHHQTASTSQTPLRAESHPDPGMPHQSPLLEWKE